MMTPEDAAGDVLARAAAGHLGWGEQATLIAAAIRRAVAEEREAFLDLAEGLRPTRGEDDEGGFDGGWLAACRHIARSTRERAGP